MPEKIAARYAAHGASEFRGVEPAGPSQPPVPTGFGGWLVLFFVFMALNAMFLTYRTLAAFVALSWMGVVYGLSDAIVVIGLVLLYHRDPLAPRFWQSVLVLLAGIDVFLTAARFVYWPSGMLIAGTAIAWAAYWNYSVRVRATFVARPSAGTSQGLDGSTASPEQELHERSSEAGADAETVPNAEELNAELDLAKRQGTVAATAIVIGLAITIGTYTLASAGHGREYYISWGAILYGIIEAVRANRRRDRARALLRNVIAPDSPSE